jgi:hypothetical protein
VAGTITDAYTSIDLGVDGMGCFIQSFYEGARLEPQAGWTIGHLHKHVNSCQRPSVPVCAPWRCIDYI